MGAKHDNDIKEKNMILFLTNVMHNFLCEPKLTPKKMIIKKNMKKCCLRLSCLLVQAANGCATIKVLKDSLNSLPLEL